MSNEKKPGCLGCIGDNTTQVYGDFNKPIEGSLFKPTSISWKVVRVFFVAQVVLLQDEDPEKESATTKALKAQISQLDSERKALVKEGNFPANQW